MDARTTQTTTQYREFTSEKNEHQPYIADMNHCSLCGTKLAFKHKVDYLALSVQEEADCPSCRIRLKTRDFGLQ
jgi:hypothetical protein